MPATFDGKLVVAISSHGLGIMPAFHRILAL